MAETYFVKCEDCGRRLPGPARTCDVCGGKMTGSAEESYYTPEGIIKKSHYREAVKRTPDGERVHVGKSQVKYSPPKADKSRQADGSTHKTSSGKPLIDRMGDAVNIFVDSDELTMDSLKEMGSALTGEKPEMKDKPKVSRPQEQSESDEDEEFGFSMSKMSVGKIAMIAVALIIAGISYISDWMWEDDYDEGSESYYVGNEYVSSDYESFSPYESVAGAGYTLSFDETYFDDSESMNTYLTVLVTGDEDIKMSPFTSVTLEFDGQKSGVHESTTVSNSNGEGSEEFISGEEEITLMSGKEYVFNIYHTSVPEWDELKLIHNFSGTLSERDTALDITVTKDI